MAATEDAAQQSALRQIEQERYDRQLALQLAHDRGADASAIEDVVLPALPALAPGATLRRGAAALLVRSMLYSAFRFTSLFHYGYNGYCN